MTVAEDAARSGRIIAVLLSGEGLHGEATEPTKLIGSSADLEGRYLEGREADEEDGQTVPSRALASDRLSWGDSWDNIADAVAAGDRVHDSLRGASGEIASQPFLLPAGR